MTEIRFDPLRARRIVIAEHRAGRPNEFQSGSNQGTQPLECPFCPGNERETPPELAADRPPGSLPNDPSWTIRVVPNRYPAVIATLPVDPQRPPPFENGPARGSHEVVIECREHGGRLESLPRGTVERYLVHLRDRARFHAANPAVRTVLVFRNSGAWSGASLAHPHTQLTALETLPSDCAVERDRLVAHHAATGRCLFCEVLAAEIAEGSRIVATMDGWVAWVPFAARYGAEIWIATRDRAEEFTAIDDARIPSLAALLQSSVGRMLRVFDDPSYNLLLNAWTAPGAGGVHSHWRIELVPRLANVGGFELATGDFIVSRTPERVAQALRSV